MLSEICFSFPFRTAPTIVIINPIKDKNIHGAGLVPYKKGTVGFEVSIVPPLELERKIDNNPKTKIPMPINKTLFFIFSSFF